MRGIVREAGGEPRGIRALSDLPELRCGEAVFRLQHADRGRLFRFDGSGLRLCAERLRHL